MMLTRRAALLGQTAAIALMLPLAAAAQDTQETVPLPEIRISGTDGTGSADGLANPATQAGAKAGTPVTEIPQSVSVIASETLKARNISKLDEALGYTAGVIGQPYGYDSDTNWYFIRGFAATATGAFQDGLAHYSYGFGGFYIDPALIERVEVLKGPASVLYGGSNPGGLINYVSKRPTGTPGGEYELGIDENGRFWGAVDANGLTQGGHAWRFVSKLQRVDGYGAFDPGFHGVIAPSLSFSLGATNVTLLASYTRIDETHVGGSWLPYQGSVVAADFGFIDREFNSSEPGYDWYERDQLMLSGIVDHDFGNGWRLSNNTRLGWSDIDESAPYAYGYIDYAETPSDADNSLERIFFQHQTETLAFLNDTRLERTLAAGGAEHRLLLGLDLKYFRMDQVQGSVAWPGVTPRLSASNPVYGADLPATTPYIDQDLTQRHAGLYLQDQIRWGDGWIATLNGRYDHVKTETGTNEATGDEGLTRSDSEFSWRAGLARTLPGGVTPYVSAASYFNPQVVNDASGNAISPETGMQYEVGVKWSPDERTLITLAAFDITRENISQSQWSGAGYTYYQIGEVRSRGLELEARAEIAPGLRLTGALTKMDVEIRDDIDASLIGRTPYSVIEDQAAIELGYDLPTVPGLTLTGGLRWLGSSWADNANTQKVPSVTLVDLGASYDFAGGWNANLAISNLTDETYVAGCQGTLACFYGEGRKASLVLRKTF